MTSPYDMMTSPNGNIFCVTGPLWGESTGHRWIPLTKASDSELWCFLRSAPAQTVEQTIEAAVIWDAIALIVTPLYWFICNFALLLTRRCREINKLIFVYGVTMWNASKPLRNGSHMMTARFTFMRISGTHVTLEYSRVHASMERHVCILNNLIIDAIKHRDVIIRVKQDRTMQLSPRVN